MEPSNGVDIEPPNLIDNNLTREEKPPATTAVPEPKPKLPEEVGKWSHQATTASDLTNHILSPILRFYTTTGLPPYYKVKSLIFCSTAYKGVDSPRDLESRRYFLEKAQVALQRCEVYTHPEDREELQKVKDCLDQEWQELLEVEVEAEAAAEEDGDDGQAEH
ncbi:hypothetical protein VSDG_06475 [Cytospora chrysosperma]|uniref:Uncharacterized protein n=1 Tax=Cytospora chrysosperma TaxID=252740 RepID=A0A423VLB2_CYTCH|nr:hypothetical protein VSDG_06475 [Valsa sordida]